MASSTCLSAFISHPPLTPTGCSMHPSTAVQMTPCLIPCLQSSPSPSPHLRQHAPVCGRHAKVGRQLRHTPQEWRLLGGGRREDLVAAEPELQCSTQDLKVAATTACTPPARPSSSSSSSSSAAAVCLL